MELSREDYEAMIEPYLRATLDAVEKAERLLEGANTDDRDDLVDGIEAVRDALAADDIKALELAVAQLADLIYYLES